MPVSTRGTEKQNRDDYHENSFSRSFEWFRFAGGRRAGPGPDQAHDPAGTGERADRYPERPLYARRGRADREPPGRPQPGRFLLGEHQHRQGLDRLPRHPCRRGGECVEHELSAQRERPVLDRECREGRAGRGADLLPDRQHGRRAELPGRGRKRREEAAHAGLHDGHEHLGRELWRVRRAARRGQDHGPLFQRRRAEADAGRQVRRSARRQALRLRRRRGPGKDADVLPPDQRQGEPDGRLPAALRQGPPVHQGAEDRRRRAPAARPSWARTGPSIRRCSPRWTCTWARPRTSRSSASRWIPRAACGTPSTN